MSERAFRNWATLLLTCAVGWIFLFCCLASAQTSDYTNTAAACGIWDDILISTSPPPYPLAPPGGTAAAPPYSFSGASGSGMYSSSPNTVCIATSGGAAACWDPNHMLTEYGNVLNNQNTTITGTLAVAGNSNFQTLYAQQANVTGFLDSGGATFQGAVAVNANTFSESATTNLVSDLAGKANDTLVMHLAGTETATGAKTFSGGITTGLINISGGAANTKVTTTGTTLRITTNNSPALDINDQQEVVAKANLTVAANGNDALPAIRFGGSGANGFRQIDSANESYSNNGYRAIQWCHNGSGGGGVTAEVAVLGRTADSTADAFQAIDSNGTELLGVRNDGLVRLKSTAKIQWTSTTSALISDPSFAGTVALSNGTTAGAGFLNWSLDINANSNATVTVTKNDAPRCYSSFNGARLINLPSPANSSVGQQVCVMQEGANILTLGIGAGVTVTMQTTTNIISGVPGITSKTATNFTSTGSAGTDGTTAWLVCTATDGSSASTWRQMSGLGAWN